MNLAAKSCLAITFILAGNACERSPASSPAAAMSAPSEVQNASSEAVAPVVESRPQEAISFQGRPLYRQAVDTERLAEYDEAIRSMEQRTDLTEDDYVELGRYYVASNRYRDAIDLYSRGLDEYSNSFKLLRHRGHRYISVRELEKAFEDLSKALEIIGVSSTDVLERNADDEPTGTYEHWVWYHIGLYHYLNADWDAAARAYERCIETALDDKSLVGASDWLYNAYQKGGQREKAVSVVAAISPDIETDRNNSYFKRVMLYKGIVTPNEILDIDKPVDRWTAGDITVGYGVANWYRFNGNEEMAAKIYRKILQTPYWNAWAYVVTDREFAR